MQEGRVGPWRSHEVNETVRQGTAVANGSLMSAKTPNEAVALVSILFPER